MSSDELDEWGLPKRIDLDKRASNPNGYEQINHGRWYKYVLGSAFSASFVEFVIFFVLTIIWFVVFHFAIEPAYPNLFPISGLYQTGLFFVITFAGALFIGAQQQLYQDLVRLFSRVMGNTNTLAMEICSSISGNDPNELVQSYFKYSSVNNAPKNSTAPLYTVLRDLNEILRAIPIAQRFEHRTKAADSVSKATHVGLDRANLISNLKLDRLPMSEHLIAEISAYKHSNSTGGLADQMFDMVYKRLRVLSCLQPDRTYSIYDRRTSDIVGAVHRPYITPQMMQSMDRQISGLTTDTAEIIAIKWIRVLSIIIYFLRTAVYIWCFSIAWQLWGDYGWVGLLAAVVMQWFILGLYRTGVKLTDPFASWNNSHYVWVDLTQVSINASKEIDEVFDRLFEQMTSKKAQRLRRPNSGVQRTSSKLVSFLEVYTDP
jgi:hypothetical protein